MHLAAPTGRFGPGPIDLADLADQDWVMAGSESYYGRGLRSACRRAGFEPHLAHQVDEQPTALAMVAAGLGVTLMSDLGRAFLPATGVDVIALSDPPRRQVMVAHDASSAARPAVRLFVATAVRAAAAAGLARSAGRPAR